MIAINVMSTDIVTLNLNSAVGDAIALFQTSNLYNLPVIDNHGKPIGIVSTRSILHAAVPAYASDDLLAIMKSGPDIRSVYHNLDSMRNNAITDVIDKDFRVVQSDIPTSAVAAMLVNLKGDTHSILVVDHQGILLGVISARDIICRNTDDIKA